MTQDLVNHISRSQPRFAQISVNQRFLYTDDGSDAALSRVTNAFVASQICR